MTKREPLTVTVPPWRSAMARTIARPSPEPPLGPRQKRSKACSACSGVRPGPSSLTVRRARSPSRSTAISTRPWPCVRALRDEVADGALERRPLAEHDRRLGDHLVGARLARELGEVDGLAADRRGRVLARERQQVVEQHAEPGGVGLDVGQHLGVGAVPGRVREVAAQGGQRRPQLVRGVADEALLGRAGALERGEHGVERLRERADLVAHLGIRQPARGVAGALDLARARRQAAQRTQRAPRQDGGQPGRHQRGDDRREQHEPARVVERVLDLGRRTGDDDGAARRRAAAELAQRRGVDAQRVGAEPGVAVAGRSVVERRPGGRRLGEDAAAEAARAGDDPPAAGRSPAPAARCRRAGPRACRAPSAAAGWRRPAARPRSPAPAASGRARR